MPEQEVQKASDKPTELLALDAVEVSLVDVPAVERKFVRLKAKNAPAQEIEPAKVESGSADSASDASASAESDPTDKKNVEKNETPLTIEQDVQKAVLPVIEALVGDYLSVIQTNATAVREGIAAGTLTKEDAYSRLWGIQDVTYKVLDNVCVVAKSLDIEVEEVTTQKIETEKADRKMTKRRRETLKAARDMIDTLMSELEDEPMATETTTQDTSKAKEGTPAAADPAAPAQSTPAAQPQTLTLDVAKSLVGDAVRDALAAATAKTDETVSAAVSKALKPLEDRLSALEGRPGTSPTDSTTSPTQKVETEKSKKDKDNVWGGSIL
jgi:hypothetical protein